MELQQFIRGLESLQRIDPHMEIITALTLMYTAKNDGQTQKELESQLGTTNSTVSRNVGYWSKWKKFQVEGQDFMESFPDPRDKRYRITKLTAKGRHFVTQFEEMLNGYKAKEKQLHS